MINFKKYFLTFFLILILAFSVSCSKSDVQKCKTASDCDSKSCKTAKCIDKKCQYSIKTNCCGNGVAEDMEDGKKGDKCSCPADYGKCQGKGKIEIRGREYDAKYLQYFCNDDDICEFGVDPKEVTQTKLIDERELSFFTLETQTTFNTPLNIKKDGFQFIIKLKDADEDLILPVKITSVQLKDGEILFGEKVLNNVINAVGSTATGFVPVSYQPKTIEEEKTLSYKIDFEYKKRVKTDRNSDGTWNYKEEPERDNFEKKFSSKVFFVNPEAK